jgi:5-methylthioadenosine/S-adenosylhomocysteine deaminase
MQNRQPMSVCGTDKFVCVAAASLNATDKFGQTLGEIETTLSTALSDYDALNLSAWDFSPLAPIVRCEELLRGTYFRGMSPRATWLSQAEI